MNLPTPAACRFCGAPPRFEPCPDRWMVICSGCYDGAEDSGRARTFGQGSTQQEAAEDWAESQYDVDPKTTKQTEAMPDGQES